MNKGKSGRMSQMGVWVYNWNGPPIIWLTISQITTSPKWGDNDFIQMTLRENNFINNEQLFYKQCQV